MMATVTFHYYHMYPIIQYIQLNCCKLKTHIQTPYFHYTYIELKLPISFPIMIIRSDFIYFTVKVLHMHLNPGAVADAGTVLRAGRRPVTGFPLIKIINDHFIMEFFFVVFIISKE